MTFHEFIAYTNNYYDDHSFDLRYGQSIMNCLYKIWPEKYKEISQSDDDCFYNDNIVNQTLSRLEREWSNGIQL